ncbi:MAG: bacillithiol biosynthesis cysteine-adding enzyme BshC [Acidobacteria bacterium]|nr:bacillithiol biosynthesis cysteine-adding enzyme BshC [Acidobacteriota bacterium]
MAEGPAHALDYEAFQDPPSPLFRDYLTGQPRVAPFYDGGRWDADALVSAAERALARARPREALAAALVRQQEARGAAKAATRAALLAQDGTAAVVTGQQAVLFGGPLFVLYKALAVVELAETLEKRRGRPVVPVFWVASDDHDFAEVRSVAVLDEAGQIRTLRYSPVREPFGQPASRIVLDDSVARLVEELSRSLPGGLHRDELMARLAQCYRPGATLAGAFAAFLSSVLPDLVVLDPSDPALKALMAPVLVREIREGSPTSRLANEAGERLLAQGYHQQVPVRSGFFNLFVLMEGERRALATQDGQVEVRGVGKRMSIEEAARLAETEPALFSPGVLLRPLAQDHILPTVAYVGGPAEVAYHAQIGPSYAHFGIPRPALVPRPSATIVEPAQARALEAEGLKLVDLQVDPEGIVGRWAREAFPEVESAFARAREAVDREMAAVEESLGALDPTLRGAADAARGRALHQIETLHEKSLRALKKREQARADRLRRTRDALFPGGSFQERGIGFVSYLARHGDALVGLVRERLDPWARGHQVIAL